jgi:hypothetical protein
MIRHIDPHQSSDIDNRQHLASHSNVLKLVVSISRIRLSQGRLGSKVWNLGLECWKGSYQGPIPKAWCGTYFVNRIQSCWECCIKLCDGVDMGFPVIDKVRFQTLANNGCNRSKTAGNMVRYAFVALCLLFAQTWQRWRTIWARCGTGRAPLMFNLSPR